MTIDWKSEAETLLKAIWTPELDPLFWRSARQGVESAWYGHVPFAHWIVRALAPRCIVELGTHNGVSYSAFCEAAQREGFGTRCFAVDTWTGDDHAGRYGEEVFAGLRFYHDQKFGAFSTLIRRRFDDALENFAEGSIDLLHIDGRHGYEDVRHDFESWRGKMSDRGVILFHDTNVRGTDFGVWRLWSELQPEFPHFEFLHAHGLGVLVVGPECPQPVAALAGLRDTLAIGAIRERFAQLGERCVFQAQVSLLDGLVHERAGERDAARARLDTTEAALQAAQASLGALRIALAETEAEAARRQDEAAKAHDAQTASRRRQMDDFAALAERERQEAATREHTQRAAAGRAIQSAAAAERALQAEASRRSAAEAGLEQILLSTTWRATRPLRTGLSRLPRPLRRSARVTLRTMWRLFTPHLNDQRRAALVAPSARRRRARATGAGRVRTDSGRGRRPADLLHQRRAGYARHDLPRRALRRRVPRSRRPGDDTRHR